MCLPEYDFGWMRGECGCERELVLSILFYSLWLSPLLAEEGKLIDGEGREGDHFYRERERERRNFINCVVDWRNKCFYSNAGIFFLIHFFVVTVKLVEFK